MVSFTMCAGKVELVRCKVEFDGLSEYFPTRELADAYVANSGQKTNLFKITNIDQTGNEWIDGMKFASYSEAELALEMGEAAYVEYLYSQDTQLQMAEYLVDLDVRMLKMEWGLV